MAINFTYVGLLRMAWYVPENPHHFKGEDFYAKVSQVPKCDR
jgi:hypothetical protein